MGTGIYSWAGLYRARSAFDARERNQIISVKHMIISHKLTIIGLIIALGLMVVPGIALAEIAPGFASTTFGPVIDGARGVTTAF